jgi:hypothetical protein
MWWTPKQAIALRQSSSGGGDETEEYELVTIKAERFDAESAEKKTRQITG